MYSLMAILLVQFHTNTSDLLCNQTFIIRHRKWTTNNYYATVKQTNTH